MMCLPLNESLIPRPHPLTRRNGLVNQVKFVGLVHTFATVSPAMFIPFYAKQQIGTDTGIEINTFTVVKEVLCNNCKSCNLIGPYHFWGISPRNLTLLTRTVSRWETPAGWA